jgi:hypothetical protein
MLCSVKALSITFTAGMMKNLDTGNKLVSILILLTLVSHWRNVVMPLQVVYQEPRLNGWTIGLVAIATLFLTTNLIAAIGMYLSKSWGYTATCIAIVSTTILFATSYLPFVNKLFFLPWPGVSVLLINTVVLSYVMYLKSISRKSRP